MPRKGGRHYVDNKQLYLVMVDYKKSVDEAEQSGDNKPRIPDYIGECLLQIANRLATKPNFANYTFKDEMVCDGIENCVNYIDNFDPEKSKNPFAYFTQIIYYAFLRRIQKEKKQLYIKHKSLENAVLNDTLVVDSTGKGGYVSYANTSSDYMKDFVTSFEEKEFKKKKPKPKPPRGVEVFYK
tara:strand:+ start:46 stop:594 length:549 start_codon:yes stop_codon:yes gene_type:complete